MFTHPQISLTAFKRILCLSISSLLTQAAIAVENNDSNKRSELDQQLPTIDVKATQSEDTGYIKTKALQQQNLILM